MNRKRVYRLYRNDGLSLRLKKLRRNVSAAICERQPAALAASEMWSMDFASDALSDGRRFRALTVVDAFTREPLAIDVDQGIKGEQVVEAMARISSRKHSTAGVRERRDVGLQPTRQAHRRCLRRVVQRSPSRRVPERTLVPLHDQRPDQDRGLAKGLQRELPSHIAWLDDACQICCCRGNQDGRMNAVNPPSGWMRNRRPSDAEDAGEQLPFVWNAAVGEDINSRLCDDRHLAMDRHQRTSGQYLIFEK